MIINSKDISGIPVFTKLGIPLGKCSSLDIDADTGRLESIRIKSGVLTEEHVVAWNSIIEMSPEKIIVADGIIPAAASVLARI
ncbi:PRC-barrel domain-containing protein [Candidatus Uhrbacteria bacterium]|nr:PRC-barrel domain-containing protein [Candidatus Uhrbacteria bacterium]